jgi:hypothetical protein
MGMPSDDHAVAHPTAHGPEDSGRVEICGLKNSSQAPMKSTLTTNAFIVHVAPFKANAIRNHDRG